MSLCGGGDLWVARFMTDDERTIKNDMDVEEVMDLARAF